MTKTLVTSMAMSRTVIMSKPAAEHSYLHTVDINALLVFMLTVAIVLLQFYLVAPRNAVQSCHLHLRRSAQIYSPPEPWWMDREGDLLLGESTQHASNSWNVPKAIN